MEIQQNVLDRQYRRYQDEYEAKALQVLRSGQYILGQEVAQFEENFARYIGTSYCVGLASGLDALWITFKLLGIQKGDEVIVQGNTYIASVMGITINGATPVFVEPDEFYNMDTRKIEEKITERTKAILVVHLYGQAAKMDDIQGLCQKYQLYLVEDCAQAHGAMFNDQKVGSFGDVGCFSFYPSKNLGAFGDGGAVTVNNEELAKRFKIFRNYGSEKRYHNQIVGANSRLDELQAGLLNVKLKHLDELNEERECLAKRYMSRISHPEIALPRLAPGCTSIWHLFVIRIKRRTQLINYLEEKQIRTLIHYPIPPHLSEAYQTMGYQSGQLPITEYFANTVLSLPLYNGMSEQEQDYVINSLNQFQ